MVLGCAHVGGHCIFVDIDSNAARTAPDTQHVICNGLCNIGFIIGEAMQTSLASKPTDFLMHSASCMCFAAPYPMLHRSLVLSAGAPWQGANARVQVGVIPRIGLVASPEAIGPHRLINGRLPAFTACITLMTPSAPQSKALTPVQTPVREEALPASIMVLRDP